MSSRLAFFASLAKVRSFPTLFKQAGQSEIIAGRDVPISLTESFTGRLTVILVTLTSTTTTAVAASSEISGNPNTYSVSSYPLQNSSGGVIGRIEVGDVTVNDADEKDFVFRMGAVSAGVQYSAGIILELHNQAEFNTTDPQLFPGYNTNIVSSRMVAGATSTNPSHPTGGDAGSQQLFVISVARGTFSNHTLDIKLNGVDVPNGAGLANPKGAVMNLSWGLGEQTSYDPDTDLGSLVCQLSGGTGPQIWQGYTFINAL